MLNSVVKISMMSAKYFECYTIILRGAVFSWTHCIMEVLNIITSCICVVFLLFYLTPFILCLPQYVSPSAEHVFDFLLIAFYHTQWTVEGSVFGSIFVRVCLLLSVARSMARCVHLLEFSVYYQKMVMPVNENFAPCGQDMCSHVFVTA